MAMERLSIETEQRFSNAVQRLETLKTERDYLRKLLSSLEVCSVQMSIEALTLAIIRAWSGKCTASLLA
jgi:hypothetical protein